MTAQFFERVLYNGEKRFMASEPLSIWLEQAGAQRPEFREVNTALWRRYIGTWEVRDGKLYLIHIAATLPDGTPVTLAALFPGHEAEAPVFAAWFTGRLCLPQGDRLDYVHMGFQSTFEEDLLLDIESGLVVATELRNNRPKQAQKQRLKASRGIRAGSRLTGIVAIAASLNNLISKSVRGMEMTCGHCGSSNPDGAKFCQSCGKGLGPQPQTCPACNAVNSETAKFCSGCGAALGPKIASAGTPQSRTLPIDPKSPSAALQNRFVVYGICFVGLFLFAMGLDYTSTGIGILTLIVGLALGIFGFSLWPKIKRRS